MPTHTHIHWCTYARPCSAAQQGHYSDRDAWTTGYVASFALALPFTCIALLQRVHANPCAACSLPRPSDRPCRPSHAVARARHQGAVRRANDGSTRMPAAGPAHRKTKREASAAAATTSTTDEIGPPGWPVEAAAGQGEYPPLVNQRQTGRRPPGSVRFRSGIPCQAGAAIIVIITVVLPPTTWATSQRHPSVPPKMHSRRITSSVKTRLRRSGHASLQWATTNPSSHAFPLILTFPI